MSMGALKEKWEKLTPSAKKIAMIVGLGGTMLLFCLVIITATGGNKPSRKERTAAAKIENALLPGGDAAKQMGLSSLPREFDRNKNEVSRLAEDVNRLKGLVESQSQGESGAAQAQEATKALQGDVQQLRGVVEELVKAQKDKAAEGAKQPGGVQLNPTTGMTDPAQQQAAQGYSGIRTISSQPSSTVVQPAPNQQTGGSGVSAPRSSGGSANAPSRTAPGEDSGRVAETYTPSGSMIQGVLLTGLDAPTGQGAMKEPTPALVRVKKESILPNRYLADFRECFVIVGGHGDLATERAMLRTENLSCIRQDKSVIDVKLQGWVVGNDGKAGVRGRLVSKQGAVLARASLAGLADGISQAFSGNVRGQLPGSGMDSDYTMQSGAFGGASTAMDRIAKYYLDLADQMHPVVEIDAGREVTIVLVRGISLPPLRARSQQIRQ